MKIISVETMRALDRRTIDEVTPGEVLMERAGEGAFYEMMTFLHTRLAPPHRGRVSVLAGKGNNGGDAYVMARCLAEKTDLPVQVFAVCPLSELKGDARAHAERLPGTVPVTVCAELPGSALTTGTVVVDGLLGTGMSGPPRPPYERLIRQVNGSGLPVIAIDVPSGLDADSGEGQPNAVAADLTVTMALPKQGLLTPGGLTCCGALRCVDIGIPPEFVAAAPACGNAIFSTDVRSLLPRRPADSHKGTFGHVLVTGGSAWYTGAPLLAGAAALRVGAGLVTVAVPAAVRGWIRTPLDALIIRSVPDQDSGFLHGLGKPVVNELLGSAQAVVFGPGIGRQGEPAEVLREILCSCLPVVIDADGLRILAECRSALGNRGAPTVLTPHPGEMRVLLEAFGLQGLLGEQRLPQAEALARETGAAVVLKGMGTMVAMPGEATAVNTSGNNGLASAGTGDVLAGMIGGFLAQGLSAWDACRLGVFVHGLAAEHSQLASRSLAADDLLNQISPALRSLTPFA